MVGAPPTARWIGRDDAQPRRDAAGPDELWTKINIEFYKDASDAVFKSLVE